MHSARKAWPIHHICPENVINFFLKLEKLVELVTDAGREFQILGP